MSNSRRTAAIVKATQKAYSTRVITDPSQVPAGYVSLSELRARHRKRWADDVSQLHVAGRIPAVKLMRTADDKLGPVWLDGGAAEALLPPEPAARPETEPAGHPVAVMDRYDGGVASAIREQTAFMRESSKGNEYTKHIDVLRQRQCEAFESIAKAMPTLVQAVRDVRDVLLDMHALADTEARRRAAAAETQPELIKKTPA